MLKETLDKMSEKIESTPLTSRMRMSRAQGLPQALVPSYVDQHMPTHALCSVTNQGWEAGAGDDITRRLQEHKLGGGQ